MLTTRQRQTARSIWDAGVDAVRAETLVSQRINLDGQANCLRVGDIDYSLDSVEKLCIVGGGKAAGYFAEAIEELLEPVAEQLQLHGWVNVPDNCLRPTRHVHLHAGRPASINEPRPEGIVGTQKILSLVSALRPNDLCLCLITGGGSALLPAPAPGISLEDKQRISRLLSANGASIHELNRVRIAMSAIKGGGLLRACNADRMITLVLSDVIGDPLDLIASGPTIHPSERAESAQTILRRYIRDDDLPDRLWEHFSQKQRESDRAARQDSAATETRTSNGVHLLANNEYAVRAAATMAGELGYAVRIIPPEQPNTLAEDVASELIGQLATLQLEGPICIIWGGEPTVRLTKLERRGSGGRNQQLILSAINQWQRLPVGIQEQLCILSGGTDGEDGPTDAAGAFVDQAIVESIHGHGLDVADHLARNDAYVCLDSVGGLVRTGPTHTNVCDIRVAVVH